MAMNDNPAVKLETRVRVMQVAREMGYVPNQYARSLVTQKKNVIGIIRTSNASEPGDCGTGFRFDQLPDTYLSDMLDAIVAELNRQGYSLLFDVAAWAGEEDPGAASLPPIAHAGRIDGLIWASGFMAKRQLDMLGEAGIPVVTIGSRFDCFDWVDTDPEEGMYHMARYVLSCGHRRIAFINGRHTTQTSARKLAGLTRALGEAGLALPGEWIEEASFSGLGGYRAMERLWDRGARPTAVITGLDVLAIGAMRFLHDRGLSVPEDISVTGYEDGILAEYANPGLTTVFTRKAELGTHGGKILENRLANPKAQRVRLILPPELRLRESVRCI